MCVCSSVNYEREGGRMGEKEFCITFYGNLKENISRRFIRKMEMSVCVCARVLACLRMCVETEMQGNGKMGLKKFYLIFQNIFKCLNVKFMCFLFRLDNVRLI